MKPKACDIILFSGKGFFSRLIQLGGLTKFSHVGIMVDDEHLLESTTLSNIPDIITGKYKSGVQVVKLKDRLSNYNGKIYHRPLERKLGVVQEGDLLEAADKYHEREYEASRWDLIKSEIDFLPNPASDLTTLFCSELVVQVLKDIGLYETDRPSDDYTPAEVSKILPHRYKDITRIKEV